MTDTDAKHIKRNRRDEKGEKDKSEKGEKSEKWVLEEKPDHKLSSKKPTEEERAREKVSYNLTFAVLSILVHLYFFYIPHFILFVNCISFLCTSVQDCVASLTTLL